MQYLLLLLLLLNFVNDKLSFLPEIPILNLSKLDINNY